MANSAYSKNREPTIDELLDEHITSLLMARDGVQRADVVELVENTKTALRLTRRRLGPVRWKKRAVEQQS